LKVITALAILIRPYESALRAGILYGVAAAVSTSVEVIFAALRAFKSGAARIVYDPFLA
jgi:hypothetical protein